MKPDAVFSDAWEWDALNALSIVTFNIDEKHENRVLPAVFEIS